MNELLKINYETAEPTVSARDLHARLKIKSNFTTWFDRMCEYGFTESDFFSKMEESTGGRPSTDYQITIDMAKQICMIQRSPEGKKIRQYFIDLEKAWNAPEQIFARALKMADKTIEQLKASNSFLIAENECMKPKADFYDQIMSSEDAIPIGDVAKIIGIKGLGRNNLFALLRDYKVLMYNGGKNLPYQAYIDRGYFEVVEYDFEDNFGRLRTGMQTLVTQKGIDFIRRLVVE